MLANVAISLLWPPRMPADAPSSAIARICRSLKRELFDSYRPELHYMRGPGPKWRETHARNHPTAP